MKKWIFLVVGLLVGAGNIAQAQTMPDSMKVKAEDNTQANLAYQKDPAFRKAVDDFRAGKYGPAQTELEDVVQKTPNNASAHNMLGYLYLQNKQYDKAFPEMEAAVRLNPNDMQARSNLGNVYLQQGRFQDAAAQFKIVMDRNKTDDHTRFNYALAVGQGPEGNPQEAIRIFQDLTTAHPDAPASAPAYRNLGFFLHANGQNPEAAAAYQKAATLDKTDTTSLYYAGELFAQSKQYPEAVSALNTVISNEAYPKGDNTARYTAHYTLGEAYAAQKDISNAIAQFRAATDVSPDDYAAWYNLGVMLAQAGPGQVSAAEDAYTHALKIKPDDAQAQAALKALQGTDHATKAKMYAGQADMEKAAGEWQLAVASDPGDDESRLSLASYYMTQKQYADAIAQYEAVAKREPQNAAVQNQLGLAYENQGNENAAFDAFQKAVGIDPQNKQAQNNIGVIYDKRGNKQAAIAAYDKALAIDPNFQVARDNKKRLVIAPKRPKK